MKLLPTYSSQFMIFYYLLFIKGKAALTIFTAICFWKLFKLGINTVNTPLINYLDLNSYSINVYISIILFFNFYNILKAKSQRESSIFSIYPMLIYAFMRDVGNEI